MSKVIPGRFTADIEGPFVVFIIGMRVNKFFAFRKWIATAMAMGPMIRTLYEHPEKGFLGAQTFVYWRGVATVQYWRSFEDLERFARDRDDAHLAAWKQFNKSIGSDGSVGIWHESFLVDGIESRNARFGSVGLRPSPEAIQEFKMQTSDFSAEFGRSAAIINTTLRSGTNSLHGSAYEFMRNSALEA